MAASNKSEQISSKTSKVENETADVHKDTNTKTNATNDNAKTSTNTDTDNSANKTAEQTSSNANNTNTVTNSSASATHSITTGQTSTSTQQDARTNDTKTFQTAESEIKVGTNVDDSKSDDDITKESKTNLIINFIPPTMTDTQLATLFSPYGTVENCKIVYDLNTGRSRGYGFVQYKNEESGLRALEALDGFMAQGKKLKVAFARPKSKDIQNANLYITNLPFTYTDDDLRKLFKDCGKIVECRILNDKDGKSRGVGFVRMDTHLNAVNALQARDNYVIDRNLPPITVKLAQRRVPKRILQLQQNASNNFKTNRGNNNVGGGRQSPNRRYVRQQGNQSYINDNANNKNSNRYNRGRRPPQNFQNNFNYQPYNQNHRSQYNQNNFNNPMYNNVNDFRHSQYPPMFSQPPYYDPNAPFNPAMNMNMGSGVNNNQPIAINMQSKLSNNTFNALQNEETSNKNNAKSGFNIIVNNLPSYYNVDHLIQLYAPFGPIQSVNIQKPSTPNQPTTGIVSYFYFDDAQKAQSQTNGRRIDGSQRLKVVFQST